MSSTLPIDRGSRKVSALRKTKNSASSAKTNVVNQVHVDGPPPTSSFTTSSQHSTETLDKKYRSVATTCHCCSAFYAGSCFGKKKKFKKKIIYRPHLMPDFRRWNRLPDREDHASEAGSVSTCTLVCRVSFAALLMVLVIVASSFISSTEVRVFVVLMVVVLMVVVLMVVVLMVVAGVGIEYCQPCRKFLEEVDRPREIGSIPAFNPKRVQDNLCCRYCCFCCTRLCCWNSRCPCAKCDKYVPCCQKFPSSNNSHLGRDRCPTLTYVVIAWYVFFFPPW